MLLRKASGIFSSPKSELSDEDKVGLVMKYLRKLIVNKGKLDGVIRKTDNISSSTNIEDENRWDFYGNLSLLLNNGAVQQGKVFSSHHLDIYNNIGEDDLINVNYIKFLVTADQSQKEMKIVNKNYHFLNFSKNSFSLLGDPTNGILGSLGTTLKETMISQFPKILDKVKGFPSFFKKCQDVFKKSTDGVAVAMTMSSDPLKFLEMAKGICTLNAWWKWHQSSKKLPMNQFMALVVVRSLLKIVKEPKEAQEYLEDLITSMEQISIPDKQEEKYSEEEKKWAFQYLQVKDGETIEVIYRRYKRLIFHYHPDKTEGKTEEGKGIYYELQKALEIVKSFYDFDKDGGGDEGDNNDGLIAIENERRLALPWE